VITLSTESIVNPSHSAGVTEPCRNCGAPLAPDQRYCLECGARRSEMSSVLQGGPPRSQAPAKPTAPAPPRPAADDRAAWQRNTTLTVIAGVGVLLLAMGVGVLIGRAGGSKPAQSAAQVITVGAPSTGAAAPAAASEEFKSDWPSGKTGYTVQLQTLPQTGTQASAAQAAKTAASAKGAKAVGALKSEEFSSLQSGRYVIYSGVYHKKSEAEKALGGLRKSFPGATVISVSNGGSSGSSGTSGAGGSSSGGASLSHPAPPTVLESNPKKGQSYEQKSKNLPNVISTG
jgi:hypothetical protein